MVAPLITWVSLAAVSTVVVQNFLKPRLPVYTLQIDSFPRLRWIEGKFKTQLPTRVMLHNENYVGLDVHALSFDLFYTGWDGTLQHLGNIEDRNQQVVKETSNATASTPVWKILPRAHFDFQDDLFLVLSSFSDVLKSLFSLVKQLWKGSGTVIVPSTGVAHIQSKGITATISLVCDNVINTLFMNVQGRECTLRDVMPGWVALDKVSEKLRLHVQETLIPSPETGGIFLQVRTEDGFTTLNKTGGDIPGLKNLMQVLNDSPQLKSA